MTTQAVTRPMVARQPILDFHGDPIGHELLYRSPAGISTPSGTVKTATVLFDWFTAIAGPDDVGQIWVNFPAVQLVDPDLIRTFPAEALVVEILEHVMVNDRIRSAIHGLKDDGYTIALDDWLPGDHRIDLLPFADWVKLDVLTLPADEIATEVAMLHGAGVAVVAEKVESWDHFERCTQAGCEAYQGFYFATPQIESGAPIPSSVLSTIKIIAEINRDDWSVDRLVELIRPEPSLATRVLKLANSTYLGAKQPADSIAEAVMRIGSTTIRRWLVVASMAEANQGSPELTRLAVTRARLTELLAEEADPSIADSAFTAGMLSAVPAMLGTSIDTLLDQVAVSEQLAEAVRAHSGMIGQKLEAALQIEHFGGAPTTETEIDLPDLYLRAATWADQVVGHL